VSAFFDTNIVLYTVLTDDVDKAERALSKIGLGGIISVQVLNEIIMVLRRRKKWAWADVDIAIGAAESILNVVDLTRESQKLAVEFAQRYGYAIYDANILASAKLAGCDTLWSEDMAHGQVIEGMRITNPFVDES
jgi:predicted nucleic acid-binding protein